MQTKLIFPLVFTVSMISCQFQPVHPSLWTIGNHKKKFQRVFEHYNKPADSLKLRAAEFLVGNMANHFYYQPKNEEVTDEFFHHIDNYFSLDSIKNTYLYWFLRDELMDMAILKGLSDNSLPKPTYHRRSDIKTIEPEFLIENIEYAFKAWKLPWARGYSFEEFCRYILPYRYGNEAPEPWRKAIYEQFDWVVDSVQNLNNPLDAASYINKQFEFELTLSNEAAKNGFRLKISNQLDAKVYGDCRELAGLGVNVLRSLGIAAALVSIPKWGYRDSGHEFTGILDSAGNWHYFNFGEAGPEEESLTYQPPKMFLKRYDKMDRFKPILVDASDQLMDAVDLEVVVKAGDDDEIFICVFEKSSWQPLIKGKNKPSRVIFENMGMDTYVYLAAVKLRGKMKAVSDIFTTDSLGHITYHKPDRSKTIEASLSRKYPTWGKDKDRLKALIGGEFSISDNRDFDIKKQLYRIDTTLNYDNNKIECPEVKGKYLRFDFPQSLDTIFDGPAEISFYTTQNDTLKKLEGKYFGSPQLSEKHIHLLTDNDMLTYVEVWDCDKDLEIETGRYILRKDKQPIWIGMELDTATVVTHVGICPRNDKNGIYPGMRYELFYWDDTWKSLGKKMATNDSIRYESIPENAVLWLKNLDEGKEERIFTLVNGRQNWW